MTETARTAPEFSRPVIADTVSPGGMVEKIEATAAERAALARRFDLQDIAFLKATVRLRRVRGEMVRVTGELEADVTQTCVVTLEPVAAHVADSFSALFAPDHLLPKETEEEEIEVSFAALEDVDVPEAMPRGIIDIGELAAQHLSLALDPYPRKEGASFEDIVEPEEERAVVEAARPNPFAELARLKRPT